MNSDAPDPSMRDKILANARMFADFAHKELGVHIEFDEAGARWLDDYIEGLRTTVSPQTRDRLPDTLGAFLGECIRQTYGGDWMPDQGTGSWGVAITKDVMVFPIAKVAKHLSGTEGDSVYGLFRSIPALLSHASHTQGPAERRAWWKFWQGDA